MVTNPNRLPPKHIRLAEKQKKYEEELINYYNALESIQEMTRETTIAQHSEKKPKKTPKY
ncbi:MAG TPA: hypothetical protein VKK79_06905 [Candidatus Lokiarchaeia archaeon]|nr:hypothetical protein [Candidatus Lokiarchaeia archaeon]